MHNAWVFLFIYKLRPLCFNVSGLVKKYDVIVLGVGSMGASACYQLSKKGLKVLGIEKHTIPHDKGSYTGKTRIFRKAYFEGKDYVPLLNRTYKNWIELESEHQEKLLEFTGLLYAGLPDSEVLKGVKNSSKAYNIPIKQLTHKEVKTLYPQFKIPEDFDVLFEQDAGFIYADRAVELLSNKAIALGAEIHENEQFMRWEKSRDGYLVVTTDCGTYFCDKLVFCTGSWSHKLIDTLNLDITKQILYWAKVKNEQDYELGKFPCWIIDEPTIEGSFYGFPVINDSKDELLNQVKFGHHVKGVLIDPENYGQAVNHEVDNPTVAMIADYFSKFTYTSMQTRSCMYSNSKDSDFYVDFLDHEKRVVLAAGFSGHGFKFVPVIGEIITSLITKGSTPFNIEFLSLSRHY